MVIGQMNIYLSFNGYVASEAGDAMDVAKQSKRLVYLTSCLDYCNALIVINFVRSRITDSVQFFVSSAQCRYFRHSCSEMLAGGYNGTIVALYYGLTDGSLLTPTLVA